MSSPLDALFLAAEYLEREGMRMLLAHDRRVWTMRMSDMVGTDWREVRSHFVNNLHHVSYQNGPPHVRCMCMPWAAISCPFQLTRVASRTIPPHRQVAQQLLFEIAQHWPRPCIFVRGEREWVSARAPPPPPPPPPWRGFASAHSRPWPRSSWPLREERGHQRAPHAAVVLTFAGPPC